MKREHVYFQILVWNLFLREKRLSMYGIWQNQILFFKKDSQPKLPVEIWLSRSFMTIKLYEI